MPKAHIRHRITGKGSSNDVRKAIAVRIKHIRDDGCEYAKVSYRLVGDASYIWMKCDVYDVDMWVMLCTDYYRHSNIEIVITGLDCTSL